MPFTKLRSLLFWLHLGCGVVAGVVILVMSVTGVLLTYQRQITAWSDTHGYQAGPASPGMAPLSPETLLAKVTEAQPDVTLTMLTLRSNPEEPASVALGPRTLFVNTYTGEVLGDGSPRVRAFFRSMTDWHRWLASSPEHREPARMVTGASNLAFLFIVLSGPFLWWPKALTWKQVRNIVWFRKGLSSKARDFNWHNTIGFWSAIPLAVIVASGVVMSYPWANNLVYRAAGELPPVQGGGGAGRGAGPGRGVGPGRGAGPEPGGPAAREAGGTRGGTEPRRNGRQEQAADEPRLAGLEELVARAKEQRPAWRTIALRLPLPPGGPAVFTIDEGDGGQPQKRGTLTLDRKTCEVIEWAGFQQMTAGRRARSWLRFAHTGEFYGVVGQTVAGLVSLGGAVLVWTGLALACRRLVAWQQRRRMDTLSG